MPCEMGRMPPSAIAVSPREKHSNAKDCEKAEMKVVSPQKMAETIISRKRGYESASRPHTGAKMASGNALMTRSNASWSASMPKSSSRARSMPAIVLFMSLLSSICSRLRSTMLVTMVRVQSTRHVISGACLPLSCSSADDSVFVDAIGGPAKRGTALTRTALRSL